MMGWSPPVNATYQISWKSAGRFRRRFFKGFYHIWAWWPSWSCDQHRVIKYSFHMKAFIQNLVQIGTVVSEKIQFEFLYVHDLGPRSRNDLDLQYSNIFLYPIRCLLLLPFRSSFVKILPPVPEKKIFEGFLPYMVVAAILVK